MQSPDFDPLYISSTFLSLPYRGLLNESQEKKAKSYLIQEMKQAACTLREDESQETGKAGERVLGDEEDQLDHYLNSDDIDNNDELTEPPPK